MALHFDGTACLVYPGPSDHGRIAGNSIAVGTWGFSFWIRPLSDSHPYEVLALMEYSGPEYDPIGDGGEGICWLAVRINDYYMGSLTMIHQSGLFGFHVVARTVPDMIPKDEWTHVMIMMEASYNDPHIYINGIESEYAFYKPYLLLPTFGGWDIIVGGSAYYTARWSGYYVVWGDLRGIYGSAPFSTGPGDFFHGEISAMGLFFLNLSSNWVEILSNGYVPLFCMHLIELSAASPGLVSFMPLIRDPPTSELNTKWPITRRFPHDDPGDSLTAGLPLGISGANLFEGVMFQGLFGGYIVDDPEDHIYFNDQQPRTLWPAPPLIDGPGLQSVIPDQPRLCIPFGLPRADLYPDPGDGANILPIVYGDFTLGGIRGPVPATLIDKTTFTYCAAYHPVVSIDAVYIEDMLIPPELYTVSTSNNYKNKGSIATITFLTMPPGPVSWRGIGMIDRDTAGPMTNVISQIVHLLTTYGNFELDHDFDLGTVIEAKADVEALGYQTSFVIIDDLVTQDHITDMMFNVMGYWRIDGRQRVQFYIDKGDLTFKKEQMAASIVPSRDCMNGDDGVKLVMDRQYVTNKLIPYFQWSFSAGVPSTRMADLTDEVSKSSYGMLDKEIILKGLRRENDVRTWAAIMFTRQSGRSRIEAAIITFTMTSARFSHLALGDLVAVSWPYGPAREQGHPMVNEVFRIVEVSSLTERGGVYNIIAVGLGAYVADDTGARLLTPIGQT